MSPESITILQTVLTYNKMEVQHVFLLSLFYIFMLQVMDYFAGKNALNAQMMQDY